MYPTDRLVTPFIVALFGALEVRAPEFCGLIDNLAYTGGKDNHRRYGQACGLQ